jgi:glycerol-3-phosphate acyltransferase PlsY
MTIPKLAAVLAAAYLLGSVPIGLLIVRARTGKDVRQMHSGRTGGTNVGRVAGFWAGLATGLGDILKSTGAVVIAHAIGAGNAWLEAAAGAMAVVGHIYSVFLMERADGKYVFRGGAGGAPTMGAAIAMWPPSALIILPASMGMLFGVGYASLATLSTGLVATLVFAWRAQEGYGPWAYAAFGIVAEMLVFWTLRPNLRRLVAGNERAVGWRAKWRARREAARRNRPDQGSSLD